MSRAIPIVLLGVVLVGSLVYLLVIAFGGADFVDVAVTPGGAIQIHHPRPWLIAALVAGVLSLLAWGLTERQRSALAGAGDELDQARTTAREAERRLADSERERAKAEAANREGTAAREQADQEARSKLEALEKKLAAERERRRQDDVTRERMVRAWRSEREFNRELRGHIVGLQRTHGLFSRDEDVRTYLLELTMRLVEAEKGVLLSPRDGSGELVVVAHVGFDNDPSDSSLARRFANEVIDHDTTVREDQPPASDKRTPADEEVQNLLAIPIYLTDDFSGVIVCANRADGFADLDDEVLIAVGDHAGAVLQNSRLHGDLRSAYLSTIAVLADAIELKDRDLRGHSDAVSQYVLAVADRMDFESDRRESLIFASLLHDVGKLGISERILLKPGALTPEERAVIEIHPRLGYELVLQVPALRHIAPVILHHHERFDGNGYPSRLRGEAIPLEARIISIADSFSAMTSDRPYSAARDSEEACAELERCAGTQFDPEVVRMFCEEVRRHPPESTGPPPTPPDAEVELHRADGEYKLGGRSFGITDSLTLLYSHRHLHESARAEAQRAELQHRPFAVIVATLLDLAEVNRTRGYGSGDETLRGVADLIQPLAGEHRALAFRASGRRIAMLVPDVDAPAAEELAGKLYTRLLRQQPPMSRVGIGTAVWRSGEDGDQIIARARQAADAAPPLGA